MTEVQTPTFLHVLRRILREDEDVSNWINLVVERMRADKNRKAGVPESFYQSKSNNRVVACCPYVLDETMRIALNLELIETRVIEKPKPTLRLVKGEHNDT